MSRLGNLDEDRLSAPQRQLREAMMKGPRGAAAAAGGPFEVWLHSPSFGLHVQSFGAHVRYGTSLAARISELAILVCARHWDAHYEWYLHAPIAEQAGIPAPAIEALRIGAEMPLNDATDSAVYNFCRELLGRRRVPDAIYEAAAECLGEAALVELVGLLGYYSLVALTLNAFEVLPPEPATRLG